MDFYVIVYGDLRCISSVAPEAIRIQGSNGQLDLIKNQEVTIVSKLHRRMIRGIITELNVEGDNGAFKIDNLDTIYVEDLCFVGLI